MTNTTTEQLVEDAIRSAFAEAAAEAAAEAQPTEFDEVGWRAWLEESGIEDIEFELSALRSCYVKTT